MRIGQAIDCVYQNPKLAYESKNLIVKFDIARCIVSVSKVGDYQNTTMLLREYEKERFRLKRKPVTFMEAFKAFRNEKVIYVECEGMESKTFKGYDCVDEYFHEEYIDSGIWYIAGEEC